MWFSTAAGKSNCMASNTGLSVYGTNPAPATSTASSTTSDDAARSSPPSPSCGNNRSHGVVEIRKESVTRMMDYARGGQH